MKTTSPLLVQCCQCRRVRQGGEWRRQTVASREVVSHGYCPTCLEETLAGVRRWVAGQRVG